MGSVSNYKILFNDTFDGEEWEIRESVIYYNSPYRSLHSTYATHITCDFSKVSRNAYHSIWSWEQTDSLDYCVDQKDHWCHYCWKSVPKSIMTLVKLTNMR